MTEIGNICRDIDLGLPNYYRKYIYTACGACGRERYVQLLRNKPAYSLCHHCGHIKHGDSFSRLYGIWHNMTNRCKLNIKYYGQKGIKVCNEWQTYLSFKGWALHNDYSDVLSIDRIDSNGNYEPNNCQWISMAVNSSKESIKPVKQLLNGEIINTFISISEASRETGVSITAISEVCNGQREVAKGFEWSFISEVIQR